MKRLLVLLLLSAAAAYAGTTGKIVGTVKDASTGEALAGVNVIVDGTTRGAVTGLDGTYIILNVPPGTWSLSASLIGYIKKTVTGVTVSVDLTTTQDFQLGATVIDVGKEVVVTAERQVLKKDLTSTEAHVSSDQIKSLPVSEVSEVLSLQSGITTDRSGGIHLRGGRASEVAYWVDGVSVSDVYEGGQAVQVDNNSVQELQVISGTFNAEYGQAMSGIVNIVTKDGGQQFHGNLSAYTGDYVTSDAFSYDNRITYLDGASQAQIAGSRSSSDLYYGLKSIRPSDNYNVEGSLSGPIPETPLSFYVSGRYFRTNGWLYGDRIINTDGSLAFDPAGKVVLNSSGQVIGVRLPDNPVPMNDRKRTSGQAKLTYQLSNNMKLAVSALGSKIDYRDYGHDWDFVPDGDVRKYDQGADLSLLWTHTIDATSFYTASGTFFLKDFKEHLFENPLDGRYVVDPTVGNKGLYEFNHIGTNNHQFKRRTETRDAKIDYTNQVSRLHQIRTGLEGKFHRLYLEDYNVAPLQLASGRYVPSIPDRLGPLYEEYTRKPLELSGYIQDKLEYERMVVNVGVRVDYFNARANMLRDLSDPNVYLPRREENKALTLDERMATWYTKVKGKSSVSPRFGISYPITDKGILHFSYGHFLQIPSFQFLYQKPDYKVTTASGIQGVYGNPDLSPQKTVMYEFGLQQQVTELLSFDVTGFYRDVRDWVTVSPPIAVGDQATSTSSYTMYINKDYANTRGITLSMEKRHADLLSFNISYTFQIAEGVNSNPDDAQAAFVDNKEPPRALTPLDWDQTHTANLTIGLNTNDWGVFLLGRYGSGLPYTPALNQAESQGLDVATIVKQNSRRQQETYTADLRAYKNIDLAGVKFNVFLKVFNLFDRRNETTVYGQTGRASATAEDLGAENITGVGRLNPVDAYIIRPDYYSEPREIQVGGEISF